MKKIMINKIFMAITLLAITSITGQVSAQRSAPKQMDSQITTVETATCVGRLLSTPFGCDIDFYKRDGSMGAWNWRTSEKPFAFSINSEDGSIFMKYEDVKDQSGRLGQSSGKSSFSDLSVTYYHRDLAQQLAIEEDAFSLPADCPDGESNIVVSWLWIASDGGEPTPCSVAFTCTCDSGFVTRMAINEKGTDGGKPIKKQTH